MAFRNEEASLMSRAVEGSRMKGWSTSAISRHFSLRVTERGPSEISPRLFDETIGSINKRQYICNHHRKEFSETYSAFIKPTADLSEALDQISDDDSLETSIEVQTYIACEAHAIGYMQSAHSVIDTMAHVIYYGLEFDCNTETKMKTSGISMSSVKQKIRKSGKYQALVQAVESWESIEGYRYLQDFTNLIKHRYLISVGVTLELDPAATRAHGLQFSAFSKDGADYPERYVDEFFDLFNQPFFSGAVSVGQELNKVLPE